MSLVDKDFVEKDAEFIFAPAHKIVDILAIQQDQTKTTVIPFDIPNVELGHHGEECSFDAIIKKYGLDKKYPALIELAKIVRGADTPNRNLTSYSECLLHWRLVLALLYPKMIMIRWPSNFTYMMRFTHFANQKRKEKNYCPLDTDIC
jgi:hypothetical protein